MALSQKHRASLFTTLTPLLGEEEAEALLAQFPAQDLETPATKDFVRAEIGVLRTELREEIGSLRTELREEIGSLRTEMHTEIGALRTELHTEIGAFRGEIRDEIGSVRTALVEMELRLSEKLRLQMVWLTGLVIAALGLMRALG